MNPYEVLEISVGASAEEIKTAYHGMAKKWHPDRYAGDAKVEAERRFRLAAEAYAILKESGRTEERGGAPATGAATAIQLDSAPERPAQNKSPEEWYQEAKAAANSKSLEKALGIIQYAIRLSGDKAEYHALYGKLLDDSNGDKRLQVRALETAIRLNPRDVDSCILLAKTFQTLGMHARASKLWNVVRNQAPDHPIFSPAAKPKKKPAEAGSPGLGEQFSALVASARDAINRTFKRG